MLLKKFILTLIVFSFLKRESESSSKGDSEEEVRKLKVALQEMGRVVKYLETEVRFI